MATVGLLSIFARSHRQCEKAVKILSNVQFLLPSASRSVTIIPQNRVMGTHSVPPQGTASEKIDQAWAKELIISLSPGQRRTILFELELLEKMRLEQGEEDTTPVKALTTAQIKKLALFTGIPFIGFGTLDNIIMIMAGEYIDTTFGAVLGISTMAAAAIGNMVSDIAGISTAGYVESLATKVGIKPPNLTARQIDLKSTKIYASLGRVIGVTIGCIIGMTPLFFYNKDNGDDDEKCKMENEVEKK